MSKPLKAVPKFTNEAAEQAFWESHDSTEYVNWAKAQRAVSIVNQSVAARKTAQQLNG